MKANVLQIIFLPIIFIRYDLLRYISKICKFCKKHLNIVRVSIIINHWCALWDAQHEYNKKDNQLKC